MALYDSIAGIYDPWSASVVEDIAFYVDEARRHGGPVVELAVGSGRIAVPIARAGISVIGVDLSEGMLAVARALAMKPPLVLADEPTGNLDTKSADGVFEVMRQVNAASGSAVLVVTHNRDLALRCDRIVELVDGRIVSDEQHRS